MAYIFIDESGQFSKNNNEKYFIIASFITNNPHLTEKRLRKWYNSKFPKKMRVQSEIKFSETAVSSELKIKTIKFISSLNIEIHYCYLLKNNIPFDYWRKNKLQSGLLYTNIISEVLEMYLPTNDLEFRVFCDERHLKNIKHSRFKELIIIKLKSKISSKSIIQIEMVDSSTNTNIQIADWIAGSIACYLEKKNNGEDYYEILKNNISKNSKELFKNNKNKFYKK